MAHLVERDHIAGAGGALHLNRITVVVMELLQALDQQIVGREPDWAAPVGVASKQTGL